jgi:hypothetical protein
MNAPTRLSAAILLLTLSVLPRLALAEQLILPIPNGGFENGLDGWQIPEGEGMCTLSGEQAASGRCSLHVVDADGVNGSNAASARVPIAGAGVFELRGQYLPVSGSGLGMYVRVLGADGANVVAGDSYLRGLGGTGGQWLPFSLSIYTPPEARYLQLWVHSYSHARVEAFLDDLHFVDLGQEALRPPWEGQYKIRPTESDRLTEADVVGPDGIVYPNWTKTGVQGGIPQVPPVCSIEQFGGRADDDADDAGALDAACVAAGERGGGAVLLQAGTYYLDRPVTIRADNVVIRGAGRDRTRLIFRYGLPASGIAFYRLPPDGSIAANTWVELHALPTGLQRMEIAVDGRAGQTWQRGEHSGNTFYCSERASRLMEGVPDGSHVLTGRAEYEDGTVRTVEAPIVYDSGYTDHRAVPDSRTAISFRGRGFTGPRLALSRDAARGDRTLFLESADGLAAGDWLVVDGPATDRWKQLTRNECRWGNYRRYIVQIEGIDGNAVTVNQPMRIEFPTVDGSYVQKLMPAQGCGIEDLSIEQTEDLWITTVQFSYAVNCWARGVTVRMCGRNPIYGYLAKWCEIRDCVFDDAWFKGGGGTAYGGWENSYDCLMDRCETFRLRHAPLVQWSASGNVIRRSVFHESDAQWHSGWTNENLFEQCVVTSVTGNGGYGFGMWASPPEDSAHGPNGPRNVVYNCDISSEKTGLWMGGMNENWLILYNRFAVDAGPGVFAKTASFDHIIRGNVFVLRTASRPLLTWRPRTASVWNCSITCSSGEARQWSTAWASRPSCAATERCPR